MAYKDAMRKVVGKGWALCIFKSSERFQAQVVVQVRQHKTSRNGCQRFVSLDDQQASVRDLIEEAIDGCVSEFGKNSTSVLPLDPE